MSVGQAARGGAQAYWKESGPTLTSTGFLCWILEDAMLYLTGTRLSLHAVIAKGFGRDVVQGPGTLVWRGRSDSAVRGSWESWEAANWPFCRTLQVRGAGRTTRSNCAYSVLVIYTDGSEWLSAAGSSFPLRDRKYLPFIICLCIGTLSPHLPSSAEAVRYITKSRSPSSTVPILVGHAKTKEIAVDLRQAGSSSTRDKLHKTTL